MSNRCADCKKPLGECRCPDFFDTLEGRAPAPTAQAVKVVESAATQPTPEGIDWGPHAADVWVTGSTSPTPIARFEYGTQAAEWAQQQYPNRYALRAVPTTAQGVSGDRTSALRASAPEGLTANHWKAVADANVESAGMLRDALNALVLEYVEPNGEVHHIANSPWTVAVEKWRAANRLLNDLAAIAQAQARTPSAASAASAPEGISGVRPCPDCGAEHVVGVGRTHRADCPVVTGATNAWARLNADDERTFGACPACGADAGKQCRDSAGYERGSQVHAARLAPASVEAGPSRGADAPLAPEGIDPYVRAIRDAVKCAEAYRESCADAMRLVDDGEILAFLNERSLAAGTIADSIHRLALQSPPPPAASVEAGPSRGADAPLAPEAIDTLDLLASACEIARRDGTTTNWPAFLARCEETLAKHGRRGVSPRTFRWVTEAPTPEGG